MNKLKENNIARILFMIGIIVMGIGLILGFVLSYDSYSFEDEYFGETYSSFHFWTFFTKVLYGFIVGMVFIGFSEIIKLLHEINWKMGNSQEPDTDITKKEALVTVSKTERPKVSPLNQKKITEKFKEDNIEEIIATPFEGYCLVLLKVGNDVQIKVVDVDGFGVNEVHDTGIVSKIMKWYNDIVQE